MDERIVRLNEVARQGNIEAFYGLIQEDVKLLEDIDELPFVDTPLHVAASSGGPQHIQKFAMEMMRLKPSFARKPNLNGYSPIHLALQEGHTQMVHRLLQVDGDLVRVKGKEGITPLHDVAAAAATEQQLALMEKFLLVCPNSIEDVTIQNQTALHIALLENNLVAFIRLVRWLRRNKSENAREILNRQDGEGNTVLHVAVSKNQTEAVRVLLNCVVNLNVMNFDGKTAQDMLQEQTQENNNEIRDMLSYDRVLSCFCLPKVITCYENYRMKLGVLFVERSKMFRKTVFFREIILLYERIRIFIKEIIEGSRLSNDDRNALLVVAALLITITYQVVLSPPGGLWQDTKYFRQRSNNALGPGPAPAPVKIWHYAGTSIAETTFKPHFRNIAAIHYITFTLSTIMTFLLLPRGYISALFKIALVQLWVAYYYSWGVIITQTTWVWRYYRYATGLCFVLVLLAFFGRHFCGVRIKSLNLDWIFYVVYGYIMMKFVTHYKH